MGDGIRSLSIYDQLRTRQTCPDFEELSPIELVDGECLLATEAARPEFVEGVLS